MSKSAVVLPEGWEWRTNNGSKRFASLVDDDGTVIAAVWTNFNTKKRQWSVPMVATHQVCRSLFSIQFDIDRLTQAVGIAAALWDEAKGGA